MKKFGEEVLAVLQQVQVGKVPPIKNRWKASVRKIDRNGRCVAREER
jgi:hypothetical protein